jgi:A118 family predicted phage portal protein
MLEKVKNFVNGMFGGKTIEEAFNVELSISETMLNAQELWRAMVMGVSDWNDEDTPSLQIASAICTEVARSVTVEFESDVTGSPRADYINEQYQRVVDNSRLNIEKLTGGGEFIYKPFVKLNKVLVSVVENGMYFPVNYNEQNELTRVLFGERIKKDDMYYILFEDHEWDEATQTYEIRYKAFISEDGYVLKNEIAPTSVEFWADVKDLKFLNIPQPLFVVVKMPQQNTIDLDAPQGVAIFSKAVKLIEQADKQFGRTMWEYEGGELSINASIDLFTKDKKTNNLVFPKGKDRLYKTYDVEPDKFALDVFNPQYRDTSLFNGLDKILKKIEFICQLSYGTISDPANVEKTATEIKASKQRFYSLVTDIQKTYQLSLEKLVKSIDILSTLYKLAPAGTFTQSFSFDDSIVSDRQTEFEERTQLLGAGVMNDWEMRMWYFGETEEEAKKNLPKMEQMLVDDETDPDDADQNPDANQNPNGENNQNNTNNQNVGGTEGE